jgi:molybdopterin-containing oxidoreductase family iron-sulfur binding subunit
MQKNPDVTVRSRGVMEKCNYCVQRIEEARITAKREGNREIPDGEIQTACQQACPTQAIVFGDLQQDGRLLQDGKTNRTLSRVFALQGLRRSYGMLDPELNTKPRTQYLVKLRNPAGKLDEELYKEGAE